VITSQKLGELRDDIEVTLRKWS